VLGDGVSLLAAGLDFPLSLGLIVEVPVMGEFEDMGLDQYVGVSEM